MTGKNIRKVRRLGPELLLLFLLGGCEEKNVYQPPPPPKVTISRPIRQSVTEYLEYTGNTDAINTVDLRARVVGYLDKILFNDGDRVRKGQLLFVIQQNTYQAQLQQAKASVLSQQANLEHAEIEFRRFSGLAQQKAAAQTDVDQWRYQRDAARASVMSAQAARELAALNLEYTQVTSPFDGRVDRHLVDEGNLVGAGTNTLLAQVNQIDPIYVYFNITEKDALRLKDEAGLRPAGLEKQNWPVWFGLADEQGTPHKGILDFAAITLSPTTGTLLMRGIFPNHDGTVLPGMYARVKIPVGVKKSALLVPMVAVGFDQQGSYVMLVKNGNVVERRDVTLGIETQTFRVIHKGLTGNEWIIIDGLLRAIPGRQVTPEKKPTSLPAATQKTGGPR